MNREAKLIPRVSTAVLTLGAAACGGGDDAVTPRSVATDFCRAELECSSYYDDFYADYDSLADCVDVVTAEIEYYLEYYREEYGAACANAMLAYYGCTSELEAASCDPSFESCYDEYERMYDTCGFI